MHFHFFFSSVSEATPFFLENARALPQLNIMNVAEDDHENIDVEAIFITLPQASIDSDEDSAD